MYLRKYIYLNLYPFVKGQGEVFYSKPIALSGPFEPQDSWNKWTTVIKSNVSKQIPLCILWR